MTSHKRAWTKGPWEFSDGYILANGEALKVIGVQVPMVAGPSRLEAIYNSCLIAAAPEMFNALCSLERALRKDSRGKTICSDAVEYHLDGQEMYAAINLARAALTKAEGGKDV
jgi:hypothetical protein